jgi:hypothetical protein
MLAPPVLSSRVIVSWAGRSSDQAVVSGSNFVAAIVLARILGRHSFGVFALLVAWQAALMPFIFCTQQRFIFLRTIQATQAILDSAVLGAVAAILSACVAVPWFGEVGAAASLTIGAACGWAHASIAARRLVSRICAATPLVPGAVLASRRDLA